jgi:hypothetical protein
VKKYRIRMTNKFRNEHTIAIGKLYEQFRLVYIGFLFGKQQIHGSEVEGDRYQLALNPSENPVCIRIKKVNGSDIRILLWNL